VRLKPGDLVRWHSPDSDSLRQIGSAGIVVEMGGVRSRSFELVASVLWEDGVIYHGVNTRWLEVLNEARTT